MPIYNPSGGGGGGAGNVVGPGSSTDNAFARFDLTTGKLLQDSSFFTGDDVGKITLASTLGADSEIGLNHTATSTGDFSNVVGQQLTVTSGGMLNAGDFTFGKKMFVNTDATDAADSLVIADAIINNNAVGGANDLVGYLVDYFGILGTRPTNTGNINGASINVGTSVAANSVRGVEINIANDTAPVGNLQGLRISMDLDVAGVGTSQGIFVDNYGTETAATAMYVSGSWTNGIDLSGATAITTDIELFSGVINNTGNDITLKTTTSGQVILDSASLQGTNIQGLDIRNDGTTTDLVGPLGDYTRIGASAATSHSLSGPNDLLVTNRLEVDGTAYFDGQTIFGGSINTFSLDLRLVDDAELKLGDSLDARFLWSATAQTNDMLMLGLGNTSNAMVVCQTGDISFDFLHPVQTSPTIFVHSQNQSTNQWISMTHNASSGVIETGTGAISFGGQLSDHTVNSNGDIIVRELEVNSTSFFDGVVSMYSRLDVGGDGIHVSGNDGIIRLFDGVPLSLGSSNDAQIEWDQGQTVDAVNFGLSNAEQTLLIGTKANVGYDYAHGAVTDPTVFLHSTNQSATEWVGVWHDQTDGNIDTGTGTLNLGATGNVNFAGATRTASTVTHDAYVELEIAGTLYKFMLGS